MAPWSVLDSPMGKIHQHLCAFHVVADEQDRQIEAHHYCTCVSCDFHQCIVYDSDKPDARLIGIEYLISEQKFNSLPEEEKVYWHSHKYEVESGVLMQMHVAGREGAVPEEEERGMMMAVHQTFGKVIHTWNVDRHPDLPLGPPSLMMSYTKPEMVNWEQVKKRDSEQGVDTAERSKIRAGYLPLDYAKNQNADKWMETGKQVQFESIERSLKGGMDK
ncbi:embryo-specific protein [Melampsora americana]|nr:embryo-specific protein [Melampsora americana]